MLILCLALPLPLNSPECSTVVSLALPFAPQPWILSLLHPAVAGVPSRAPNPMSACQSFTWFLCDIPACPLGPCTVLSLASCPLHSSLRSLLFQSPGRVLFSLRHQVFPWSPLPADLALTCEHVFLPDFPHQRLCAELTSLCSPAMAYAGPAMSLLPVFRSPTKCGFPPEPTFTFSPLAF